MQMHADANLCVMTGSCFGIYEDSLRVRGQSHITQSKTDCSCTSHASMVFIQFLFLGCSYMTERQMSHQNPLGQHPLISSDTFKLVFKHRKVPHFVRIWSQLVLCYFVDFCMRKHLVL